MNKETFCAYPFNSIFLGSDGKIKPCCSSGANLGDINKTPIKEILNGKLAREIRQSIVDEKWHPTCNQCYRLEQYGARTERTGVLDKFEQFKDATADTFKLQKLDFRWSNTCNLACNYCFEYFSSQWSNIKGIRINSNKNVAEDALFALIDEEKDSIININLLGGEPLLQKQNHRLFDLLPDKNYYILTNLSLDLEKNVLGQKLISMTNVDWGVSFENIGNKFEYVRHGAKWPIFTKNLEYLRSKQKEINAKRLSLAVKQKEINAHPLYCTYSAFNLIELYDWYEEIDVFSGIYWCAIQNIPGQNVFTLPNDLKLKAIKEIENCIDKYENTKFRQSIDSLKEYHKTLTEYMKTYNAMMETELLHENFRIEKYKQDFVQWIYDIENKFLSKEHKFIELWPEVYESVIR
jgi:radical SAM protein with 4Fe4S-binding SPASM domain